LLGGYIPFLRKGGDAPPVDEAIAAYLPLEGRSNVAARLAVDGIFSRLQESCIARNDSEASGGFPGELASAARGLYFGLKKLAHAEKLSSSEWAEIAAGLRAGWSYFPSSVYAGNLESALRHSGNRRGLFEFKAYRYIDESGPNPFRYAGLFLRWLFLPGKRGFGKEINDVKQSIKADILRTSPGAAGLPLLGGELYDDTSGQRHLLSFKDPGSELFGRRTIFAFFQTTCTYCVTELQALGRLYPAYRQKSSGRLALIGLKMETNLPPVLSALAPFEKNFHLSFPLLENSKSGLPRAYRVREVPLLVFMDERGAPLWTIALRGQGHIEEKLSWFIDDLMAEQNPSSRDAAGDQKGPRVPMDFYYDPANAASTTLLDQNFLQMERRNGVGLDIARHLAIGGSYSETLKDRLLSLRVPEAELPVAIVGGRVIQGVPSMLRDIPNILKGMAGQRPEAPKR
jgi:hypothetical protein